MAKWKDTQAKSGATSEATCQAKIGRRFGLLAAPLLGALMLIPFFGFFVSSIEDPELILEQNIRDLNDQVPRMNESIAMVRASGRVVSACTSL